MNLAEQVKPVLPISDVKPPKEASVLAIQNRRKGKPAKHCHRYERDGDEAP